MLVFSCCITNHKTFIGYNNICLLCTCGSGILAQLSWVLCSGLHKAVVTASVVLTWSLGFSSKVIQIVVRIQFLEVVGLRLHFLRAASQDHSPVLQAAVRILRHGHLHRQLTVWQLLPQDQKVVLFLLLRRNAVVPNLLVPETGAPMRI